jgi:hypothetical protein
MKYPLEKKIPMLHQFHEKLFDKDFSMVGCGEKHYKTLLENFQKVNAVFLGLKPLCASGPIPTLLSLKL